jgi:hypothetical protein
MNNIKLCAALVCCLLSIISSEASAQSPTAGDDLILVRQTDKSPDAAVEAIRTYVENRKWVYLGANKVKPAQGEVIFVKVCVPEVAKLIFPLGLKFSAMLPCGNLGIYQNGGKTEISMLHPRYMEVLVPNPEIEKASAVATPLLSEMLEAIVK